MIELTLRVALLATAVNLPLAVVVSWFMTRKKFHGAFVVDILISLPLALPPAAIGFFLLLLLGRQGPLGMLADSFFGVDIDGERLVWFHCGFRFSVGKVINRLSVLFGHR